MEFKGVQKNSKEFQSMRREGRQGKMKGIMNSKEIKLIQRNSEEFGEI